MANQDQWATWLLERRFAGGRRGEVLEQLSGFRDRVLDNAHLTGGETLLDVGSGDGLIGFGALDRGAAMVVFSDVSRDLLQVCRSAAADLDVSERCRFILADATDLAAVADSSVDVVTTRSVLIYVAGKQRAFEEFHRVLRPGGRMSLFEPINRMANSYAVYDAGPVQHLADRVRSVFEQIQPPHRDPMLNFDERDLIDLAEHAGLAEIHLHFEVEVKPPCPCPWETFLQSAGNPRVPTYGEAMNQALNPAERKQLAAHLRPLVEHGQGRSRLASAYLYATKR